MTGNGSTILTVGTLLSRAQDQGMRVRALVQGEWLEGVPVASDSHGVVLDDPEEGQYLIRLEAVMAIHYVRHPQAEEPSATRVEQEEPTARTGYAAATRPAVGPGPGGD